ncbi:Xaa-Pro peptidase family protein [Paenibacillus sp. N1-5-1-14]|uniref:M24 family metallopeptidase n=1 Tax=Paenibacillus radicibacter TaxID=2972488 RepID=UPI0021596375|nr:Xaa-Pro peptidase family protein [Paenibacillus radicibacter]MCR8642653.1 Xaa-Pro peptidase family protein [Paenibacillus radicibacter]
MNSRIQNLYSFMERQSLDVLLVTMPKHVYYLTGFYTDPHERFLGLVLVKGQDPFLLVPSLDLEKAQQTSSVSTIHAHTDTQNPYAVLKSYLPSSITSFGVEKSHLTVAGFEALSSHVEAKVWADIEQPLREMRVIKTPEEIVIMKKAIRIVEDVLRAGVEKVRVGVTEMDIVAELEYQMRRLGSQGPSFGTLVLAGEKSGQPHGEPSNSVIKEGELLLLDLGVFADGYASDITRTFAVGELNAKNKEMYDVVLQANLRGIEAVRPDVTFASIDYAARKSIVDRGYGDYFITRLGHGLGLEIHEYPSVHGENQDKTREGMLFTIEPGVYVPGHGGVRIEDDVIVTADGVEVLTSFPKELTIIGV